jgi:hypothetical protein
MRWVGRATQMREMRNTYRTESDNLKGRDFMGDLGAHWRMLLRVWTESMWLSLTAERQYPANTESNNLYLLANGMQIWQKIRY